MSEVADLYAEALANSDLGASGGVGRRMSDQGAQLAVAAAEHAGSDRTWQQSMGVWNKRNREWQYTDHKRFGNASRRAFKRVTGQALDNPHNMEKQQ